ncbi:MAG: helix-turn-helix domain-containing protein [Thermoleophilia bacterium]|nr:helix-turn-helix domain-containing protein [Thermoleophilia bacterium]
MAERNRMVSKNTADALEGVGARMRALREERAMSLRALARLIDVTPSLISQIETGKINPSVSSLYAIANALDVPMDVFFGRKAPTTSSSPAGRRLPTSADELNNRPVLDPDAAPPGRSRFRGRSPLPR